MGVIFLDEAQSVFSVGGEIVGFEKSIGERFEGHFADSVALLSEVVGVPLIGLPGFPDEPVDDVGDEDGDQEKV